MNITRKDLEKNQIELKVELSLDDLNPLIKIASEKISKEIKIEGFRPGKVPFEVLKQKVGEISILEEAARVSINKNIYKILNENIKDKEVVGQPEVNITKVAVGSPLEYKINVSVLPEIKIGEYKNFNFQNEEIRIEEGEINKTIDNLVEMRAQEKISDKIIDKGDKVITSVNLFIDKVPLEDGQNPEVTVLIGKDYFVEGFDKNLIGLKKGDKKEFSLVYPENHWRKNLAGKLIDFKIEIKDVYERILPEINDDLAKAFQFKGLSDLKESLKKTLLAQKEKENNQKLEIKILDKIIDNFNFGDIPDVLIKSESSLIMKEVEHNLTSQGANFEDYLKSLKKTQGEFMLDILPNAVKRVKVALALKEIIKLENISISESELKGELESIKKRYSQNSEVLKNVSNPQYQAYLENVLLNQRAIELIKKWNIKDENLNNKQKG